MSNAFKLADSISKQRLQSVLVKMFVLGLPKARCTVVGLKMVVHMTFNSVETMVRGICDCQNLCNLGGNSLSSKLHNIFITFNAGSLQNRCFVKFFVMPPDFIADVAAGFVVLIFVGENGP